MTRREKRAFIQRSSTKEMWYRLRHNTSAIVGTILFIVIAVSCFASPLYLDYEEDIIKVDAVNKLEGPSLEHLCGTDELGRDVLYRILWGGKTSILMGLISLGIAFVMGIILGTAAAYFGKTVDMIIMRALDVVMALPKEGEADFSKARFVGMDEWLGVPPENEGSCENFLRRSLFGPLGVSEDQICLFDAMTSEPERECERMSSFVRQAGGLDFVLLGVGMNGHLALNEPHAGLDIPARRVKLDAETVRVSEKYFSDGGHAPEYGITLGVPELLGAREVWLTIFGEHKRETSRRLLDPETRAEDFPAAAALSLERAVLVFDRAAYPAE